MPKTEQEIKQEIENLYILFRRIRWEKVCLLIMSSLPPGRFASKIFIYNKMKEWYPLDPNKNHLESISKALYGLHRKKLIIKEDVSIFGKKRLIRFFNENKEKEVNRSKLVFRLPKEGEEIKMGMSPRRMTEILRRGSSKKKI